MTGNTQRKIQSIENTMYHHGLIKLLIEAHLKNTGDDWESFLVRNHFKEVEHDEPNTKIKRSRRNLSLKPKDDLPLQQEQPSWDETPLVDVLENIKNKNVRRIKTNDKEEIISRRKTKEIKQAKTEQEKFKNKFFSRKLHSLSGGVQDSIEQWRNHLENP